MKWQYLPIMYYLVVLMALSVGCDVNKADDPMDLILPMRRAFRNLSPEEFRDTARSLNKKHEESKTLMPSIIKGQSKLCWDKCRPGDTNMKEKLLDSLPPQAWSDGAAVKSRRRAFDRSKTGSVHKSREKKRNTKIKLIIQPDRRDKVGWKIEARVMPFSASERDPATEPEPGNDSVGKRSIPSMQSQRKFMFDN